MYRALYRTWRPQVFSDVVGQEAITTALQNQILASKVGHAYLFTGTRGTGKTTCAKIFAKAVNCETPDGANPCGKCECCVGLENGSILDVIEIDAASNNSVDDIRDLRDETAYRPSRCKYKVYIIDEVHMLSTSAFNALLKIMEEPPSHVIFILATTEIHKVPATILSRCQRYDFMRIPADKIAARLRYVADQESIALTEQGADLISRLADGAMRDALSLLDTCSSTGEEVDESLVRRMAGVADKDYLFALSDALQSGDGMAAMEKAASLREQSIDVKRLTEELIHHYRNLMLAAVQPDGSLLQAVPAAEQPRYIESATSMPKGAAIQAIRRLASALDKMSRMPDPRIELELALFDIAEPPMAQVVAAPHTAATKASPPKSTVPVATQPVSTPTPTPSPVPVPSNTTTSNVISPTGAAQQTPVDGEIVPLVSWGDIVTKMAGMDRMLYSYMKGSSAYLDGKRVLISGGDMFLSYMREYEEASNKVKEAIFEVTGVRYAIGPYKGPAQQIQQTTATPVTAQDTLEQWQELGVPVEYE